MKKVFFLFAALLLITVLTPEARAVEMIPYSVKGINISIPETYGVITREMGIDDEILRSMEETDMYLDAWKEEGKQGIRVTIRDMEIDPVQLMDDETMEKWIPYFEEQSEEQGKTVVESEVYHHGQTVFYKMHVCYGDSYGDHYIIQYNTIIFKEWICIEMHFGEGTVSSEQEADSEEVIDSVFFRWRFFKDTAEHTDAFQYIDPVTGAEFTVPENWSINQVEGYEYPYMDIFLNANPNVNIIYTAVDAREIIPHDQLNGKTWTNMENPMFGPYGVARELGISPNAVLRKHYGNTEYAVGRKTNKVYSEEGEIKAVSYTTLVAGFDNGYAYYFFFPGWEDHENYKDLEAMVSSMKYPEHQDSTSGSALWKKFLIAAVVLALTGGWITLRGKREQKRLIREGIVSEAYLEELKNTRRPKEAKKLTESGRPKNCRFCGAKLPKKGAFCPECGTRIEE